MLSGDRRRGRHHHSQRILVHVADAELVVQVRSRGKTGRPDISDNVPLRDARTLAHVFRHCREMPVPRRVLRLMTEHDEIAVTALAAGDFNNAVSGRSYPRSRGRAVVDASVRAPFAQYRMEAGIGKAGSNPGKLQRRPKECLTYVLAVQRVVAALTVSVLKVNRLVDLAAVDEFGG